MHFHFYLVLSFAIFIFKYLFFFDFFIVYIIRLILSISIIVFFSKSSYSNERYVLPDRKISSIGIENFEYKDQLKANIIKKIFVNNLIKNKSNIKVEESNQNKEFDVILKAEIKEYISEIKEFIISDFINYNIMEHQLKLTLKIKIVDPKSNDLIWIRTFSKYNTQSWMDFSKQRIGANQIIDYFLVPNQLAKNMQKQYDAKEFEEKLINDVTLELIKDLVKLE